MAVELTSTLARRAALSEQRLAAVRQDLLNTGAHRILGDNGTVYATGSMARGDASEHSDLDVFILSRLDQEPALSGLDGIRLKAKLIECVERNGLPKFSDDGKYLTVHTVDEMLAKLGKADDDYENLFTARMLLLLESRPLLGERQYENALSRVVDKYWSDFEGHEREFLPIFLTNDIIRYWKVLCLNYEAFTSNEPEAKRRHQNYKLKFSRLLTCYSAILDLLSIVKRTGSVSRDDAIALAHKTPIERLIAVSETPDEATNASIRQLLEMYDSFLHETDAPKDEVRRRFADDGYNELRRNEAKAFGDEIFKLLTTVGRETPLYRYLVV
jgi:hypothetical protein